AISFMGKKTWDPGRSLHTFITATFGLPLREQVEIVEKIAAAMADVGPMVREAMREHAGFVEIGKRMLLAWQGGMAGLREKRAYNLGDAIFGGAFIGFLDPAHTTPKHTVIGRSGLLGRKK
ncbi:MAG: hypothetical protein ABI142_13135, partial [Bryocella sp.]